jgi:hypothetical protein
MANIEELVAFIIPKAVEWGRSQQGLHRPRARALTANEQEKYLQFFTKDVVARARIKEISLLENPPFYNDLRSIGLTKLIDFTALAGITFIDTILIARKHLIDGIELGPLLFHELVHIVQYDILGVEAFFERYVGGWAENDFEYTRIPLEQDAYELEGMYKLKHIESFDVEAEVRRRLGLA